MTKVIHVRLIFEKKDYYCGASVPFILSLTAIK